MKEGKRHENSLRMTKFCLMEVSIRENKETIGQGTMKGHNKKKKMSQKFLRETGIFSCQGTRKGPHWKKKNKQQVTKAGLNSAGQLYVECFPIDHNSTDPHSSKTTLHIRATPWLGICVCRGLTGIIWGFLTAQVLGTPNPQVVQESKVLNIFSDIFLWNFTITKIKRRS